MSTISNNKLPEWRKALNSAVENYQSTQAWYEENPDNPSAEQDMDAAEGDIEKLIKQYGVLIVLNLLDEIDELQERRKADNQEPAGYHVIKECGKVGCSVATLEEAEKTRDFWNKKWIIRPYFYTPPASEREQIRRKNEPVAYLVCNGHLYQDRPFLDLSTARKSVKDRNDGAEIKALCVCEISAEK
nr:hypothetical protein [Salmonella enterica]